MTKIEEIESRAFKRTPLDELEEKFIGIFEAESWRQDSRGKNCLYVTIKFPDGSSVRQKYSPMHLDVLLGILKKQKIDDTGVMLGKAYNWEMQKFRIGNPRWFPVSTAVMPPPPAPAKV